MAPEPNALAHSFPDGKCYFLMRNGLEAFKFGFCEKPKHSPNFGPGIKLQRSGCSKS
jgi:hypothetical protein